MCTSSDSLRTRSVLPTSVSSVPSTCFVQGKPTLNRFSINEQHANTFFNEWPQHQQWTSFRPLVIRSSSRSGLVDCVGLGSLGKGREKHTENVTGRPNCLQEYGLAFPQRLKPGESQTMPYTPAWQGSRASRTFTVLPAHAPLLLFRCPHSPSHSGETRAHRIPRAHKLYFTCAQVKLRIQVHLCGENNTRQEIFLSFFNQVFYFLEQEFKLL